MYGFLDKTSNGVGYTTTTIHRMLSDLTCILNGNGSFTRKNRHLIFGGDLNVSVQWDEKYGKETHNTHAHRICFERIEDFGLINSFSKFYSDYVQTLRSRNSSIPWQNDYIFISRSFSDSLKSCKVLGPVYDERIADFSDHNLVIVELNF